MVTAQSYRAALELLLYIEVVCRHSIWNSWKETSLNSANVVSGFYFIYFVLFYD